MTELTLDKQIEQFPGVTEFVDARGDELHFIADGDLFFLKHNCRIWKHFFSHISIPGLRPKQKKYIIQIKTTANLVCQKPVYEHVHSYETDTLPDYFKDDHYNDAKIYMEFPKSSPSENPNNSKKCTITLKGCIHPTDKSPYFFYTSNAPHYYIPCTLTYEVEE